MSTLFRKKEKRERLNSDLPVKPQDSIIPMHESAEKRERKKREFPGFHH